jgi:hypothetical protein
MTRTQQIFRTFPLALALSAVAGVWLAGAVWSFDEQTRYAASCGFSVPWLLPLVLDGLAVSLAGVAYAAALDGRAAVQARLMTMLAVAASAASNGAWAWTRTYGDPGAVTLAVCVPVAANLAFEVLLSELRRQVHRRRGLPAAVPIPVPRVARILLAPVPSVREWRALVLDATAPARPRTTVTVSQPVSITALSARTTRPHVRRSVEKADAPVRTSARGDLSVLARDVAERLEADGRSVTRAALTAGIRGRGRSVSNERAGQLLAELRQRTSLSSEQLTIRGES